MKTKKTRNPFAMHARRRGHTVMKTKRGVIPRKAKYKEKYS